MDNAIINTQKSLKTFVFQREDTHQSVIVDLQVDLKQTFVNLSYFFSFYCPLAQNKVSIYDPAIYHFVSLSKIGAENGYIPISFLEPTFILIRYKSRVQYIGESDSMDSGIQSESRSEKKDSRSKERPIIQVIELVKKWRDLHMHGYKTLKRRLNLQDAAKIVGISKKSLDDYYCQLRLGQLYNFNFYDNLNQKMGTLRNYVKGYRPQRDNKRKQNEKHPKNLKIIEQFDQSTKSLKQAQFELQQNEEYPLPNPVLGRNRSQLSENRMIEEPNFAPFEENSQSNSIGKELFSLENEFFKCFDLAFKDQRDLYFDVERDFRKKDFALDSDSFLLFE